MIKTEYKEVTKTYYDKVPVGGTCDTCRKELVPNDSGLYDYYRVSTSHSNWGNDSVDSYEYYDFCCVNCLMRFVEEYWQKKREHYNPRSDTYDMEIMHKYQLEEH